MSAPSHSQGDLGKQELAEGRSLFLVFAFIWKGMSQKADRQTLSRRAPASESQLTFP